MSDRQRPARTFSIRELCREFKCTPRALRFYEDKGLLSPARNGLNRVYSYKDRARLQLILGGKRLGLALAEIGEILDLYEINDGGTLQAAETLRKFRERLVDLEQRKIDIAQQVEELTRGCAAMERRLAEAGVDLSGDAVDYDQKLRRHIESADHSEAK